MSDMSVSYPITPQSESIWLAIFLHKDKHKPAESPKRIKERIKAGIYYPNGVYCTGGQGVS